MRIEQFQLMCVCVCVMKMNENGMRTEFRRIDLCYHYYAFIISIIIDITHYYQF